MISSTFLYNKIRETEEELTGNHCGRKRWDDINDPKMSGTTNEVLWGQASALTCADLQEMWRKAARPCTLRSSSRTCQRS